MDNTARSTEHKEATTDKESDTIDDVLIIDTADCKEEKERPKAPPSSSKSRGSRVDGGSGSRVCAIRQSGSALELP